MRLLIIAQKVDRQDSVLGFFHNWIICLAKHCEAVVVLCLEKGEYELPANVRVLSLGKETGRSRIKYLTNFFKYIWRERQNYDTVFVHMNQEYVLLGWKLWKLLGKKIYLWRNHHEGSWLTDLAAVFCTKVFCTSRFSYTAKYRKTILMPVGVELDLFKPNPSIAVPRSFLFLGRLAPVKKVDVFIQALGVLNKRGIDFTANIYGDVLPTDRSYADNLKKTIVDLKLSGKVAIHSGVAHDLTPAIYQKHQIYVNLSSSGMYDKTIFEALASGCVVLASNQNLVGQLDERQVLNEVSIESVVDHVVAILALSDGEKAAMAERGTALAANHSLKQLGERLMAEMI